MLLLIAVIVLFVLYSSLIIYYWQSWVSIPEFRTDHGFSPIRFSIIIPARNEEQHIGRLLDAIAEQNYPKELVEIIVVDDHSTDATPTVVKRFPHVRLLRLDTGPINSYKKKAIETGIAVAQNEWILCTDADCIPAAQWIDTIAGFIKDRDPAFIAAPVVLDCNLSLVQMFQAMDFMILQGITAASVHKNFHAMSNGANLAYRRDVFHEVGGFKGIDDIASGDDMLLMQKIIKQFPGNVHYLKSRNAMVSTQPANSWKEFFGQRIRWASKAMHYRDKRIFIVLLLVYIFNFSFIVLLGAGFLDTVFWWWLGGLWIAKTLVELPFLYSLSRFFNKKWAVNLFFLFQPLHILYTIIAGFFGQFGKYEWKGRKVR